MDEFFQVIFVVLIVTFSVAVFNGMSNTKQSKYKTEDMVQFKGAKAHVLGKRFVHYENQWERKAFIYQVKTADGQVFEALEFELGPVKE